MAPPAQKYPAAQESVAADSPAVGQYLPLVQFKQNKSSVAPVMGLKVPAGHETGAELPCGQYLPEGHTFPVTPSTGVALMEFNVQ